MTDAATLVRRFVEEAWNRGDLGVVRELFHEPYDAEVLNHGLPPLGSQSIKQIEAHVREHREAFPDLEMKIEELIEDRDRCFVQSRLRGTQQGLFMGAPPTGRKVNFVLSAVYRARAGKLTGHRVLVDLMGLMQQLGRMPDMGMMTGPPPGGAPPGAPPPGSRGSD